MAFKKRFKRKGKKGREDFELQITALADVLIVVLVFLLKSYATGVDTIENVEFDDGIQPPVISKGNNDEGGLRIEISKNRLLAIVPDLRDIAYRVVSIVQILQDIIAGIACGLHSPRAESLFVILVIGLRTIAIL